MRRVLAIAALLMLSLGAQAELKTSRPPVPLDAQQEARYYAMLPGLRCLVCQNESLADSDADLAADLRYEIREQIAKGSSDEQVRTYLTDRYGDFVLYKPPLARRTILLWTGPFLLLAVALGLVLAFLRRNQKSAVSAPTADPAALKRILDEP